jgi:hypothetical protein
LIRWKRIDRARPIVAVLAGAVSTHGPPGRFPPSRQHAARRPDPARRPTAGDAASLQRRPHHSLFRSRRYSIDDAALLSSCGRGRGKNIFSIPHFASSPLRRSSMPPHRRTPSTGRAAAPPAVSATPCAGPFPSPSTNSCGARALL